MILSDGELWAELESHEEKHLVIDPVPEADNVVSSAVDLRLHHELFELPDEIAGMIIEPQRIAVDQLIRNQACRIDLESQSYEMAPNTFLSAKTEEKVRMPPYLAARVEGKSKLGRLGLAVHVTAPTIHAGYEGRLTLEMSNSGPFTLKLTRHMKICQMIVERLGEPAQRPYTGEFQDTP